MKPITEKKANLKILEDKKQKVLEELNKILCTKIIQVTNWDYPQNTMFKNIMDDSIILYAVIDAEWNETNQKFISHYQNQDSFFTPDKHFICVKKRPEQLPNGKFLLTCFSNFIPNKEFIPVTYGSWYPERQELWYKMAIPLYDYLNEINDN